MMRKWILMCMIALGLSAHAQSELRGVFLMTDGDTKKLWLFADGYSSLSTYTDATYKSTTGGPFTFDGKKIVVQTEYNDADNTSVGNMQTYNVSADGKNLKDTNGKVWIKQKSNQQELDGLWRITGRKQGDDIRKIHQSGTRKTIKLLIDGYFQWMAIDPGAKTFSGSGGGHYSFEGGKYSEHILFFSRDNTRVDARLTFDGKIQDGEWHHSGKSSKGAPIYEIWSRD